MLSEDLENLAANVRSMRREGKTPSPLTLENLAHQLDRHADQARGLERHTVPFAARCEPAALAGGAS